MKRLLCLIIGIYFMLPAMAGACSLPAYPIAAAMPRGGASQEGVHLVLDGTSSFYYLVREGTTLGTTIVWDPAAHNSASFPEEKAYKFCTIYADPKLTPNPEVDIIHDYGYFKLDEMVGLFRAIGNRGDTREAFFRDIGGDAVGNMDGEVIPTGPAAALAGFAKPGQGGVFSITWDSGNTNFPAGISHVTDESVANADIYLPNRGSSSSWLPPFSEGRSIRISRSGTMSEPDRFLELSDGKLLQAINFKFNPVDLEIDVRGINPDDFIAYIEPSTTASEIHVGGGITNDPDTSTTRGASFTINFTTPSISSDPDEGMFVVKVDSPPAGYELSGIYWEWEEILYSPILVTTDDEGNDLDPADYFTYYSPGAAQTVRVEIQILVYKIPDDDAYVGYKVYSAEGPIASTFTITDTSLSETGETVFEYSMRVLDSNPYFADLFTATVGGVDGGVDLSQTKENTAVTILYNYPTYHYKVETDGVPFADMAGKGLVDLADGNETGTNPDFKSYTHETKWHWKKSQASVANITRDEFIKTGGKIIGSVSTITGTFTIPNPRPWHIYCAEEGTFRIFAMANDTKGNAHPLYEGVVTNLQPNTENEFADLTGVAKEYPAIKPSDGAVIPANTSPAMASTLISESGFALGNWMNPMISLNSVDDIGPEIQVVVFDTRTNRHHVFGSSEHNAWEFIRDADNQLKNDYEYTKDDVPYHGKNAALDEAHKFTVASGDMTAQFERYLVGPNAASLVSEDLGTGLAGNDSFVCQTNTRLVFYARAFDNANYMEANGGVTSFGATMTDHRGQALGAAEGVDLPTDVAGMVKPFQYVFRNDTTVAGAQPYELKVTASDGTNNRELILQINVIGRTLEIRTLEERRERLQ